MTRLVRARWSAIGAAVAVTLGGGGLIGVTAATPAATGGVFTAVSPTRILDTRSGSPVSGSTIAVQVTGTLVPSGATAVAVNLTVTGGVRNAGYGFVTAFPCTSAADPAPNASTLNFVEGVDIANSTTVPLGATGKMCLSVYGTAHLLVDVAGYLAPSPTVDAYTRAETDARIDEAITDTIGSKVDASDLEDLAGDIADDMASKADRSDLDDPTDEVASKASSDEFEAALGGIVGFVNEEIAAAVDRVSTHLVPRLSPDGLMADFDLDHHVGWAPSIAIGHDGAPAIVHTATNGDLLFSKCGDPTCSSTYFSEIARFVGLNATATIAIGHDGNPIIAYNDDVGTGQLVTVACNDPLCRDEDETVTEHGVNGATGGHAPTIALLPNSWPVIAFVDANDRLRLLSCVDRSCTDGTTTSPIAGQVIVGDPSMTIGPFGHPMIAVGVQASSLRTELLFLACNDRACDGADETSRVLHTDASKEVAADAVGVTLGTDGHPFVAYRVIDDPNGAATTSLYVYACGAVDCDPSVPQTPPTPRQMSSTTHGGAHVSLGVGIDGNPVIVHISPNLGEMEVIWCIDLDCSDAPRRSDGVAAGGWQRWTSMAIGVDGVPIIAYHDVYDGTLKTTRPWWMAGGRR